MEISESLFCYYGSDGRLPVIGKIISYLGISLSATFMSNSFELSLANTSNFTLRPPVVGRQTCLYDIATSCGWLSYPLICHLLLLQYLKAPGHRLEGSLALKECNL